MVAIVCWSLPAVLVCLVCGFLMGRWYTLAHEPRRLKADRERTLTALLTLMASTDKLNEDVDHHNSDLETAHEDLQGIEGEALKQNTEELGELQSALMSNITRVMKSNRRLEHDLVVSRYKLETQAQELDRSRIEARTDGLTDVGNRKAFDETFAYMISRNKKSLPKGHSFGLMLIDIDHFKRINDTFGHNAGDEVLTSISRVLKDCVRPKDFVARLGGDEFAILLEGLTDSTAEIVGERIRSTIEICDFSVGHGLESTVVTMSMGLAVVQDDDYAKALYERADTALYRSKELGRNRLSTIVDEEKVAQQLSALAAEANLATEPKQSYEEFKASFGDSKPIPEG